MDWMLSNGITTWFIICTTRIDDKFKDCAVAILTGIMRCCMPRLIVTPQYLCAVCFYKGLNWNQQPESCNRKKQISNLLNQYIRNSAYSCYIRTTYECRKGQHCTTPMCYVIVFSSLAHTHTHTHPPTHTHTHTHSQIHTHMGLFFYVSSPMSVFHSINFTS